MLWTVVVCDLVYKLRELRDLFGDATSKTLLDEIENLQKSNPRSPEWELSVLDKVAENTPLLDTQELVSLRHLQKLRHLSAHPILSESSELLIAPSREQVRALMFTAIDAVLSKNPTLATNTVQAFVRDLEDVRDKLVADDNLARYLKTKWLAYTTPLSRRQLVRALWKFCFRLADAPSTQNRAINLRALRLIARDYREELKEAVSNDVPYFSQIANDEEHIRPLALFLAHNPEIYACLAEHARALLQSFASSDYSVLVVSHFLAASPAEHFDALFGPLEEVGKPPDWMSAPRVEAKYWDTLQEWALEHDCRQQLVRLATALYTRTDSWAAAKAAGYNVQAVLQHYDSDDLRFLCAQSEQNNQTWGRGNSAVVFHDMLIERWKEVVGTWPAGDYPNISKRSSVGAV